MRPGVTLAACRWRRGAGLGALALALAWALAGCRVIDLQATMATPVPNVTATAVPRAYSGTITCVGSSVLAPLIVAAGAQFRQAYPFAYIVVITTTSQSALSAVQDGGADIGLSDVSVAAFRGVDGSQLHDYPLAATVYAVITHPGLDLTSLSRQQLRDLYIGKAADWSGVGGPALPTTVISQPKGAGPRALFRQLVLDGALENNDVAVPQETSQDVVAAVAAQPGAVGYVSLNVASPDVRVLNLDGVAPSAANVRLGHYRFWGIEHLYTKGPAGGLAGAFIDFLLSSGMQDQLFKTQGFIPRVDIPPQSSP